MSQKVHFKSLLIFTLFAVLLSMTLSLFLTGLTAKEDKKVEIYQELSVFSEALSYIKQNYVKDVDDKELVYGAIKGVLKNLDPHSSFMTPDMFSEMQVDTKGRFEGIGIEITIRDEKLTIVSPIEGTPAFDAGLKASDWILKIDDAQTKDMSLSEAAKRIRGPKGTKVKLTIWREGFDKPKEYTITRGVVKVASVSSKVLEDNTIGYVRIRQFQENTSNDVITELKKIDAEKLDGLILDIRFNAGGLLTEAVNVTDVFLPKGQVVVSTKGKVKEQSKIYKSRKDSLVTDYPIIVLVNAGSASASEILAGALKDYNRAVILGTKTFGKGSVQTVYPLEDGSALRLTTAEYYTPNGRSIQAEGIVPDIIVENLLAEDRKRIISEEHVLREKDLIEMDQLQKNNGEKKDINEEKKDNEEGEAEEMDKNEEKENNEAGIGLEYIEDLQLQRAIDIIKASTIFKKFNIEQTKEKEEKASDK